MGVVVLEAQGDIQGIQGIQGIRRLSAVLVQRCTCSVYDIS